MITILAAFLLTIGIVTVLLILLAFMLLLLED